MSVSWPDFIAFSDFDVVKLIGEWTNCVHATEEKLTFSLSDFPTKPLVLCCISHMNAGVDEEEFINSMNARIKDAKVFASTHSLSIVFWFRCSAASCSHFVSKIRYFDFVFVDDIKAKVTFQETTSITVKHVSGIWQVSALSTKNTIDQSKRIVGSHAYFTCPENFAIKTSVANSVSRLIYLDDDSDNSEIDDALFYQTAILKNYIDANFSPVNHPLYWITNNVLPVTMSSNLPKNMQNLYFRTDNSSASTDYKLFQKNPLAISQALLRVKRHAFIHFSVQKFLEQICRTLNLPQTFEPLPFSSIFVPTYRLDKLSFCVENFRRQNYKEKELVLAVHTNEPVSYIKSLIKGPLDKIRIVRVPQINSVSTVINAGIDHCDSEFAVKMDDDDFYGPNYLTDMIAPNAVYNVELFGKPPGFIYLSAEDATYYRIRKNFPEFVVGTAHDLYEEVFRMSGATHSGRTSRLREVRFDDRIRGTADTAFFERCAKEKVRVGIWDPFNTIVYRADAAQHNWQVTDETLKRQSIFVGLQLAEDQAYV